MIFIFLIFILAGCNPFASYQPDAQALYTRHWAKSNPQPMQTLYCYALLGGSQCYDKEIKGKEHLLIGQHSLPVTAPPKPLWERLNLHPLLGVDADTVRKEMNLKPQEKIYYYDPVRP